MKITHNRGVTCDYCKEAIGDPGSDIHEIFKLESDFTPGRHMKLCKKDLDLYYAEVKQEREAIEKAVNKIGIDALTERERRMYKELH